MAEAHYLRKSSEQCLGLTRTIQRRTSGATKEQRTRYEESPTVLYRFKYDRAIPTPPVTCDVKHWVNQNTEILVQQVKTDEQVICGLGSLWHSYLSQSLTLLPQRHVVEKSFITIVI